MNSQTNQGGHTLGTEGASGAEIPMKTTVVVGADDVQSSAHRPFSELPPVDPELFERAKAAVTALRGQGRRANGTAGPGNTLALKDGLTSRRLVGAHPDIQTWHRDQVLAIEADLGGEAELSALSRAAVREAARLEVILGAMGDELLENGTLTAKGKTRAATTTYLKALDRFVKLTGALGLARRAKKVPSLGEYLQTRAATAHEENTHDQ